MLEKICQSSKTIYNNIRKIPRRILVDRRIGGFFNDPDRILGERRAGYSRGNDRFIVHGKGGVLGKGDPQ